MTNKKGKEKIIVRDKDILGGEPIIKGTRITVDRILYLFKYGYNVKRLLREYPQLNEKQIQACLDYAIERLERLSKEEAG